jgi:hypothetical protein
MEKWKFWKPDSGATGGIIMGIILLFLIPLILKLIFWWYEFLGL